MKKPDHIKDITPIQNRATYECSICRSSASFDHPVDMSRKQVSSWFEQHKNCPEKDEKTYKPDDIQCPVCGYYCLGKGGHGCIDKPTLI